MNEKSLSLSISRASFFHLLGVKLCFFSSFCHSSSVLMHPVSLLPGLRLWWLSALSTVSIQPLVVWPLRPLSAYSGHSSPLVGRSSVVPAPFFSVSVITISLSGQSPVGRLFWPRFVAWPLYSVINIQPSIRSFFRLLFWMCLTVVLSAVMVVSLSLALFGPSGRIFSSASATIRSLLFPLSPNRLVRRVRLLFFSLSP